MKKLTTFPEKICYVIIFYAIPIMFSTYISYVAEPSTFTDYIHQGKVFSLIALCWTASVFGCDMLSAVERTWHTASGKACSMIFRFPAVMLAIYLVHMGL